MSQDTTQQPEQRYSVGGEEGTFDAEQFMRSASAARKPAANIAAAQAQQEAQAGSEGATGEAPPPEPINYAGGQAATAVVVERPPLSDAEAMKSTRTIMTLRDGVQSTGLALIAEGSWKSRDRYKYPQAQFNALCEAWAPIVQRSGIRLSPWVQVITTEALATGPLVAMTITARTQRIRAEKAEAQMRQMALQMQAMEEHMRATGQAPAAPASPPPQNQRNPDSKKRWEIDDNGCFTHPAVGPYSASYRGTERPEINEATYQLLVRHNGEDKVKRVYNIP